MFSSLGPSRNVYVLLMGTPSSRRTLTTSLLEGNKPGKEPAATSSGFAGFVTGRHSDCTVFPGRASTSFSFAVTLSSPCVADRPVLISLTSSSPALRKPCP